MEQQEVIEGNKLIAEFMGVGDVAAYRNTGRKDDNGIPIIEGSVIIADGYGNGEGQFYCVVYDDDEGQFGSCAYRDFEPLNSYKSIIVKGHCTDFIHLLDTEEWSGNLGEAVKDNPEFLYHTSFDWLMPVVEKIEQLGFYVQILTWGGYSSKCNIGLSNHLVEIEDKVKIDATWRAIVAFIKYYNSIQSK